MGSYETLLERRSFDRHTNKVVSRFNSLTESTVISHSLSVAITGVSWLGAVGKRNLRKNPIFTVINHFDPYQEGFFTVNLQGHVGCAEG
jgi:hypothetical protein